MYSRVLITCIVVSLTILVVVESRQAKPALAPSPLAYSEHFVEYKEPIPVYAGEKTAGAFPAEELWIANKGRSVVQAGKFEFPDEVRRVWIDVGANLLQRTRHQLFESKDVGLIGVEPLEKCWGRWPKMNRLIALPFALSDEEGKLTFYQTKGSAWSSLSKGAGGEFYQRDREISREIIVDGFHLSRVINMVPEDLPIEFLKVDVQGKDLDVLKSAGDSLRRVHKLETEVTLVPLYENEKLTNDNNEEKFDTYLESVGFKKVDRQEVILVNQATKDTQKFYADVTYVNTRFETKS